LTTLWAPAGHILAPVTFLVGGYFIAQYLRRHWPLNLSQVLAILSLVFLTMMCVSTATRIRLRDLPAQLRALVLGVQGSGCPDERAGSDRFGVLIDPEGPVREVGSRNS